MSSATVVSTSGDGPARKKLDLLAQQRLPLNPIKRKTGLYKDEADRALALRAIHSVVLSLDEKKGPINAAYQHDGKVVFLSGFDASGLSLEHYIQQSATS